MWFMCVCMCMCVCVCMCMGECACVWVSAIVCTWSSLNCAIHSFLSHAASQKLTTKESDKEIYPPDTLSATIFNLRVLNQSAKLYVLFLWLP